MRSSRRAREYHLTPKVLLLYPPEQSWPNTQVKPNGSMAYPYLAAALEQAGIEVAIFDACVGSDRDDLDEVFFDPAPLPSGLLRTGVKNSRILEEVVDFDIVGITSIFTQQETMVLETARLIKQAHPDKLLVAGGGNARARLGRFLDSGFDIVCTSEAERTIVEIARVVERGSRDFGAIPDLAFRLEGGRVVQTPNAGILWNLDELPVPAWRHLPLDRYWRIRRPPGGHFRDDEALRYIPMMTSRGCPFSCSYCHIAGEKKGAASGAIGRFRAKSAERVVRELDEIESLGATHVFIEDDSLLGRKKRGLEMLRRIRGHGFQILDVSGLNIVHMLDKRGEPDHEVLEALQEARFRTIVLAFESASQRVIERWASNKWNVERANVRALVKALGSYGIEVAGNFMLGWPDESREEILHTVAYARDRLADGLSYVNYFLVLPLPGTPLFEECLRSGHLDPGFDPDRMHWQRANLRNTRVPPAELEELRDRAWLDTNTSSFTDYKKSMRVSAGRIIDPNTGEIHNR